MSTKCARPRPLAGTRPLNESNAGANDRRIVDAPTCRINVGKPLPAELLELADWIAAAVRKRSGR